MQKGKLLVKCLSALSLLCTIIISCVQSEEKPNPQVIKKEIQKIYSRGMDPDSGVFGPLDAIESLTSSGLQPVYGSPKENKYKKFVKPEMLENLRGELYVRRAKSIIPCPENKSALNCAYSLQNLEQGYQFSQTDAAKIGSGTPEFHSLISKQHAQELEKLFPRLYQAVVDAYMRDAHTAAVAFDSISLNHALLWAITKKEKAAQWNASVEISTKQVETILKEFEGQYEKLKSYVLKIKNP
jgi:hypothetical protein